MEKLKYFAMALLVAVSAGFVSCSDDDDNVYDPDWVGNGNENTEAGA